MVVVGVVAVDLNLRVNCGKYNHDSFNCWYWFDETYFQPPMPPSNSFPNNQGQYMMQGNYSANPGQGILPRPPAPPSPQLQPTAYVATQTPQYMNTTTEFHGSRQFEGQTWYPDSGASHHITADSQNMNHSTPFGDQDQVSWVMAKVFPSTP